VLDAFSSDTPPFHLLTREAFEGLRERLAPGGLVVANIVGSASGPGSRVIASVVATMDEVIAPTQVFAPNRKLFGGDRDDYVSTTFLVSGEIPSNHAPFTLPFPENMRNYLDTVLASRVTVSKDNAQLLSDAYAPLEAWSDAAVRAMRY